MDTDTHLAPAGAGGPLLTRDDVAAALNTTPRHVRHLLQTGQLSSVRLGGKVRVRASDLTSFIAHLPRRTTSEKNAPRGGHRTEATIPIGPTSIVTTK